MNPLLINATLALTLAAPLGGLFASPPKPGSPMLVLLPPWADGDAVVAAAGGQVIGPISAPFAVIAYGRASDFVDKLHRGGALIVSDATLLANLCGATP